MDGLVRERGGEPTPVEEPLEICRVGGGGRGCEVDARGLAVYDSYPESCRCILTAVKVCPWSLIVSAGRDVMLCRVESLLFGGEGGSISSISLKLWYVVSDKAKLDLCSMPGTWAAAVKQSTRRKKERKRREEKREPRNRQLEEMSGININP